MIIKQIIQELETARHPVAKALYKGEHCKVLVIGFKNRMKLVEHKAHQPTKLTVLTGHVWYSEGERELELYQYDEVEIPVNITHSLEAMEDSLCLLTQG